MRICKQDNESVLRQIYTGDIDAIAISTTSLVDDIILSMHRRGVLSCLKAGFKDKRAGNSHVPFELVLALSIAAKMRLHTSLSDIPFALTDHRTIVELGYSLHGEDLAQGLMSEGTLRNLIGKFSYPELFRGYNVAAQDSIFPQMDIEANIHILDCTKIEVEYYNNNYEGAGVYRAEGEAPIRGYKLSTIRGIVEDTGIIEEIRFGPINMHDMTLSKDMLLTSKVLKPGDILLNDRGFLDRDTLNVLKTLRGVDTFVPLRKNMMAANIAVQVAKECGEWKPHPSRAGQKIHFVPFLREYWASDYPQDDVDINACVVWDEATDFHAVFATTDMNASAEQIIKTYELRPEIEEDYRQLKDFWQLEDFKSTKLNVIAFHIVCTLLGYLFFQLYTLTPEGQKYLGKSLPVAMKKYRPQLNRSFIIYAGNHVGIFAISELFDVYTRCDAFVKNILKPMLDAA